MAAALLPLCPCIVCALPKELKMAKEILNSIASGFARASLFLFSFSFFPSAPHPFTLEWVGASMGGAVVLDVGEGGEAWRKKGGWVSGWVSSIYWLERWRRTRRLE